MSGWLMVGRRVGRMTGKLHVYETGHCCTRTCMLSLPTLCGEKGTKKAINEMGVFESNVTFCVCKK